MGSAEPKMCRKIQVDIRGLEGHEVQRLNMHQRTSSLKGKEQRTIYLGKSYLNSSKPSQGFPGGSLRKTPPADAGDVGSSSVLGRASGVGNASPLHYSCLENPVDRGVWWATVHGVAEELDMT